MTALWLAAAVLIAGILALLMGPLMRGRQDPPPSRHDLDLRVYRAQLAEVDRDVERGLLGPAEAEAARTEVKRRMLALADVSAPAAPRRSGRRASRVLAAVLAVAVPASALGIYLGVGSPDQPDAPLAERRTGTPDVPAGGQVAAMEDAVKELARRLEDNPRDAEGWTLLGHAYLALRRFEQSADALRRAYDLAPDRPDIAAAYGEALVAVAGGVVGSNAADVFAGTLRNDPRNPRARFYLGLKKAQEGDVRAALQDWVDLVTVSPADAPWLPAVRDQIARAAGELGIEVAAVTPSAAALALGTGGNALEPRVSDIETAAKLPPEERDQMIRSMVGRLAARLKDNPDDRQGWVRLAHAYDVLGEAEKAADARARAATLDGR